MKIVNQSTYCLKGQGCGAFVQPDELTLGVVKRELRKVMVWLPRARKVRIGHLHTPAEENVWGRVVSAYGNDSSPPGVRGKS